MDLPQDFISVLNAVTNKRARFVIDTILEKGYCSTEDLKNGGCDGGTFVAAYVIDGQYDTFCMW